MTRPLYIVGAGGLAREMALLLEAVSPSEWRLEGFIAADSNDVGRDLKFGRVVGDDDWLIRRGERCGVIVGVGHPRARERIVERYNREGSRFEYPSLVHPTAVLDRERVVLGKGNMVTAGCVFTCDIAVGDFNVFNLLTTVGHDVHIGSYSVLNPGTNVSGGVTVEDVVLIGTGAQILENLTIGAGSIVGAGSVVTRDVPPGATVVGVPARPLESRPG